MYTYVYTFLQVYLEPLNRSQAAGIADPSLVKDIFYQIPEIHNLHERFLYRLRDRVEHWDGNQKIGDIFVNTVSVFLCSLPLSLSLCIVIIYRLRHSFT